MPDIRCEYDTVLVGPFVRGDHFYVVIDGKKVRGLTLYRKRSAVAGVESGEWTVVLDDRIAWDFSDYQVRNTPLLALAANCLAFGAGYGCFGTDSKPNPVWVDCSSLDGDDADREASH